MRARYINEENFNVDLFIKEIKAYTNYDGEWKAEKKLDDIFKNLDINKLKIEYPNIFNVPPKYKKPNVYYFRGSALSLDYIKKLGKYDEIYDVPHIGPSIMWNDRPISFHRNIVSFTLSPFVANGFAESYSSWNLPPYDLSSDIPAIYHVSADDPNFIMNPDWIKGVSYIDELELFLNAKNCTADISILIDENLKKIYDIE